MVPRSTPMATSLTAASPPKRRDRPRVARIGSGTRRLADQQTAEAAADAREAAREKDHEQDDRAAEEQLPMRRERGEDLLQGDEHERAGDAAIERAHAAENEHEEHVAGLM